MYFIKAIISTDVGIVLIAHIMPNVTKNFFNINNAPFFRIKQLKTHYHYHQKICSLYVRCLMICNLINDKTNGIYTDLLELADIELDNYNITCYSDGIIYLIKKYVHCMFAV